MEYRSASARSRATETQQRFEVRYYDLDATLQRLTFPDYDRAKEFAQRVVRELADKRTNFITLRVQDAYDYQRAITQLAPTGLSLPDAVRLVVDNIQLLAGGGSIPDAVLPCSQVGWPCRYPYRHSQRCGPLCPTGQPGSPPGPFKSR